MKTPTYPKANSIVARYLARFLKSEELIHREADNLAGSYRLSGYVHYLERKHKWIIDRREVVADTNDPIGRDAKYTKYWLPAPLIEWAGNEGQEFARTVLNLEAKRIAERVAATTQSTKTESSQQSCLEAESNTSRGNCQDKGDDEG